ncbi:polysaccharide biosynthesis/export protein [Sandaracinobacter neustonicus]|uniref:Polysaccharide biosynthesis/export protein n=1 Tax=Sandaracinobacter neustonicus TaxID=1715348 RepID=A0A501XU46_9SPHN|nr:SLBB domain-containing protein [Sandaracinobacter neustonicus]TPE63664.1 polysaccharide biosynthesis/export protein [Sandaracinobacter neustonicus]
MDPSLLRNLQTQLGASELPQADSGVQQPLSTGEVSLPGSRIDTLEEQEVRRAEARRQLRDIYMPSEVEQDYRRRLGDKQLRQFGYDFFQSAPPPTGTRAGAISDEYVLGIGDQIQVSFRGATNRTQTVRVDRDGKIVVGDLRPIPAAGRSLGSVRNDLAAETKRTLLATDVYVSVGEVRAVSVFVGGEVERPGQYSLTSLSDVGTALAQAGGIRRSGSLRQVRIVRAGGGTVSVDLYGLLGIGAPPSVRLQDGDKVIVPVIGPTIAVTGAVARPGIYELRGSSSVGSVVGFAGGAIRQRGAQVVISRIGPDGTESFIKAAGTGATVLAGDSVQVLAGSAGGAVGRVQLQGFVDNAGARPLVAAGTVAELVGSPSDLRSDTYQLGAILVRRDPSSGARLFQMVNLARELRERNSTPLQSEDQLFVFSRADIAFMNSVAVRQVVLGQPNPMPQCKALDRLATLVKDTEAARFNAVTRSGLVVISNEGAKLGAVGTALGQTSRRTTDMAVAGTQTRRAEEDKIPECPKVFEDEPELLPVLIEHSISIGGSVRRPGAYPVGELASARDLSLVADGLLVGSRDLVLDINRSVGGPTERVQIDGSGSMMSLTTLAPGDDIRFNAQQGAFEGSGVLLSGEVARPGLYSIRKGEKLSELLQRAGGLTNYGYAYGAIFTRRSVKEAQEEGFRRTARELNNSLLAIAARSSSSSGDGLAGAAALIQTLGTTEAPGRMVVEADPRVLELRPDLDTIMEPGDSIFIPKRPNYVLALGDVNNPGALQFVEGKSAQNYLREAGGMQRTADDNRAFMVLPNGMAQPIRASGRGGGTPPPGTTIIVPKNIDPLYRLSVFRDVTTIIAQLATSVATVAVLATN